MQPSRILPQFPNGEPPPFDTDAVSTSAQTAAEETRAEVAPPFCSSQYAHAPKWLPESCSHPTAREAFRSRAGRHVSDVTNLPGDRSPAFPITSKYRVAASRCRSTPSVCRSFRDCLPRSEHFSPLFATRSVTKSWRSASYRTLKKLRSTRAFCGSSWSRRPRQLGPTLPCGSDAIKFRPGSLLLRSSWRHVHESHRSDRPSVKAVVPTGVGGFWTHSSSRLHFKAARFQSFEDRLATYHRSELHASRPVSGAAALEPQIRSSTEAYRV